MAENPIAGKPAPEQTVRRLPLYRFAARAIQARGSEVVSCTQIAGELGFQPIQVRKDIAHTGIVGKPGVGYVIDELVDAIERFLGWKTPSPAFLVGAGHLGAAILGYAGFRQRGLNIVAAFDSDPAKVGSTVHGVEVYPVEKLPDLLERMRVRIGVLTVNQQAAQDIATMMVLSGVEAIWNFAPVRLEVPESVIVENVDLSASLAVLSCKLAAGDRAKLQT